MKALRWLLVFAALAALPFFLSGYYNDVYRKLLLWIALALSYNFLFGISGQIAFSHFAFYGIGAYSVVIFLFQLGMPLPVAVLAGILVCTAIALAVAIPSTRLEGFYLALATLALAQLFIVVLNEGGAVTGGTSGLVDYHLPAVFGVRIAGPWTARGSGVRAGRCATTRRPPPQWASMSPAPR
jgi:branched-chain amino acid transport system permease protein